MALVDRARDVVVTDDVVRGSGAGIIVTRSDTVRVAANRVSGSAFAGIPVFESQHVAITDNTVTTSRNDTGIGLFDGSSHNGAFDNLVAGNSVAQNDSGVIVDVGTHDNRVVENVIEDSLFEGIAVVGSDGNLIARNRVARNGAR